ncbi:MAG TPA: 4a-hydroxytetrahydrobiopterin dehydratase [Pseudonocardiaceae bacterium]|nr:4a-hydroxytetrahydrobiopterin dehydratase [Pseudonocardiaceae bacterium]
MSGLLNDNAVNDGLADLTGWIRAGQAIVRTVELADFPQAIQVVDRVAEIAEGNDHHPDIDIRWRTLTFTCSTHSEGGITAADLSLARAINATIEQVQA